MGLSSGVTYQQTKETCFGFLHLSLLPVLSLLIKNKVQLQETLFTQQRKGVCMSFLLLSPNCALF